MDEWDEKRKAQQWAFKKELSLGDIITFCTAALAVMYAYTTLEKRIALIEAVQTRQVLIDAQQDLARAQGASDWRREFDKVNAKLDRLYEYRQFKQEGSQ